jgi:hypothetical protein
MNEEMMRKLRHNEDCLGLFSEGDLIEYIDDDMNVDDRDHPRFMAIYMGNSMIMRFCSKTKSIVYESYWKIAYNYYIYLNRDLDKKFFTLPIHEILNRANNTYVNNVKMSKYFNSDKNFALW